MPDAPVLRLLIVDDSALFRQMLRHVAGEIDGVEVVGTAKDGVEAVKQIVDLRPDLVTLDVQMPNLDGLGVLKEIKRRSLQTHVIMVSSLTAQGAPETVDALLHGALDCIQKPTGLPPHEARGKIREVLATQVAAIQETQQPHHKPGDLPTERLAKATLTGGCIAIGSSTGGPEALRKVLPFLPASLSVPVYIVQHMPAKFTVTLAQRLNELTPYPLQLASHGMLVEPGKAYLAAGGQHLGIAKRERGVVCRLTQDPPRHGCRPSFDYLLETLADVYGGQVVATVLTGMGSDGLAGCRMVRAAGGVVIAQDQQTSVVYGMPKAVVDAGVADEVLPLDDIGPFLAEKSQAR